MAAVGKPLSREERKAKSMLHWLQYGIGMTARRDIGGAGSIENHAAKITEYLKASKSNYIDVGLYCAQLVDDQTNGIRERQSRTVLDFKERINELVDAIVAADVKLKDSFEHCNAVNSDLNTTIKMAIAKAQAFDGLFNAVVEAVVGSGSSKAWRDDWQKLIENDRGDVIPE